MLSKRDLLPAAEVRGGGRGMERAARRPGPGRARRLLGDRRGPRRAAPADPRVVLPRLPPAWRSRRATAGGDFEAEHRVYRPEGEGGYWVEREEDGAFRVHGPRRRAAVRAPRPRNEEALAYLEQRLNEIGVDCGATAAPGSRPATRFGSASTSLRAASQLKAFALAVGAPRSSPRAQFRPPRGRRARGRGDPPAHLEDWSLPKGKLEPGESFEQAALREVEEEAGLRGRARRRAELPLLYRPQGPLEAGPVVG